MYLCLTQSELRKHLDLQVWNPSEQAWPTKLQTLTCLYCLALFAQFSMRKAWSWDMPQPSELLTSNGFMAFLEKCQVTECSHRDYLIILAAWPVRNWVKWWGKGEIRRITLQCMCKQTGRSCFIFVNPKVSLNYHIPHSVMRKCPLGCK